MALKTQLPPNFQHFCGNFAGRIDGSSPVFVGSFNVAYRVFVTLKNIFGDTPSPYKMLNFAGVLSVYN
jgi:hypothetical protein